VAPISRSEEGLGQAPGGCGREKAQAVSHHENAEAYRRLDAQDDPAAHHHNPEEDREAKEHQHGSAAIRRTQRLAEAPPSRDRQAPSLDDDHAASRGLVLPKDPTPRDTPST